MKKSRKVPIKSKVLILLNGIKGIIVLILLLISLVIICLFPLDIDLKKQYYLNEENLVGQGEIIDIYYCPSSIMDEEVFKLYNQ